MDHKETIKTWRERIRKAGHTQHSFAKEINMGENLLSQYIIGNVSPSIESYQRIENGLEGMGV